MEVMLLAVFISLSNLICLIVGVKVGQKAHRGEDIRLVNPVEKVQIFKDKQEHNKEYKKEQKAVEDMLHNIDVYDGTGMGQIDINL